ncbi:oligosaccharide flippase family protein [Arthrobacter sp. efr-133-R2A-120]|uniref:oligosaccharide flippase family protein n=1 Tax=Arthrobacter sp. efr-133-R2A-120 TaxID=3040277 RepID=UPI00254F26C7|nr:oligosaccharide flippase family protein [Arthrobacter sp. efr-133-R2A-120]
MASIARSVASGSAWSYGAQIGAIVMQLGYAAITSRLVSAQVFGTYSVALLISNLVAILSVAGLGQSVARSKVVSPEMLRGLGSIALMFGVMAALLISPFAEGWALLWGDESAKNSIVIVGAAALFAPSVGLLSGVLRRDEKFKELAQGTMFSTLAALVISAFLAGITGVPEALIAAPVMTQIFSYCFFQIAAGWSTLPGRLRRDLVGHLSFSWRVSLANLMAYGIENLTRFSVARFVGPSALGAWNRGDVMTTTPFDKLQSAMMQALYPQFRHDVAGSERTRRVWTDILIVVGWVTAPACAFLAGAIPSLVPLILGPGWNFASQIAVVLAIAAGFRGVSIQLASALEALSLFRWIWSTHALLLLVQLVMCFAVFQTSTVWPAVIGCVLVPIVRHGLQVYLCRKAGLLHAFALLKGYLQITIVCIFCALLSGTASYATITFQLGPLNSFLLLCEATLLTVLGFLLMGRKLPIIVILHRYGLFRRNMDDGK